MTIRPVDMQTLIPRSSEVSRVQHMRESQAGSQQQVAQAQIRQQADQSLRQVVQSQETPKGTSLHPDGGGGSAGRQTPRRRGRGKAEEVVEAPEEPGKGKRLDIKM